MRKHQTVNEEPKIDSPEAEPAPESPEAELERAHGRIRELEDERDGAKDQLLRTMADFQNFRKRTLQESEMLRQFATERLVTMLLPVLDNFERTIGAMEKGASIESVTGGIRAVERQLRSVLEAQSVTRIPAQGEHFDPELHEAIGTEPSEEHEEGVVIHEVESGYRMADRVIRPAKVKVARKP